MRSLPVVILVSVLLGAGGATAIALWLREDPTGDFALRRPGMDNAPAPATSPTGVPKEIKGTLTKGEGTPSDLPGSWPRFRGADFDNISKEKVPLARTWPASGPRKLWQLAVGEGYAAAAIHRGRVYIIDYDKKNQADVIRCLSLADGKDIWRYSYDMKVKRNHGMSRTIPTVTDKVVIAMGPLGHVTCLDATTGEKKWAKDLVAEYGTKVPPWYAGQCPLIDGDRVILAPGGTDVLMTALDCETGETVWETPNPRGWGMTHSSIVPMEFYDQRMYLYCASKGVVGVAAEDGKEMWQTPAWKIGIANIPSPVPLPRQRIFLTGGYNAGSMLLDLTEEGETIVPVVASRIEPAVFSSEQHTPILYEGHLYAVRPDGQLTCASLDGQVVWTSGAAETFGLGPFLIADGLIYVMDDDGKLTMAEATPTGYQRLGAAQIILGGHDAWGPIALAGGRMIVRDMRKMVCLDVRAE